MSVLLAVLLVVDEVLMGVVVLMIAARWRKWIGRLPAGKHVTRPLSRRLGAGKTVLLRFALIAVTFAANFAGSHLVVRVGLLLYWLWVLDDVFFGEDDEHKRWDWVKVKLRKWKPVMQRLAQQWKPRAPKVPVPA